MKGAVRLGLWIAVLFAGGVIAVNLFGSHESWFVRAAQDNAVRCLTETPCARMEAGGAITAKAKPPLGRDSLCAKQKNWKQLEGVSNGQTSIVLTCTDGRTYLYHFGALRTRKDSGPEQWMACGRADCSAELKRRMN